MELLLFRHGIAEPQGPGQADADRALTPQGIERTTQAARGLARIFDRPQAVLTSPKLRARQTAAIVGEAFDLEPQLCDVIATGTTTDLRQMLRDRTEDRLILVGHKPTFSELAEQLCVGRDNETRHFIELKKAGAILLDAPLRRDELPAPATLRWLVPPRVLRTLGASG